MLICNSAQWLRDTGNQFAHLHKLLPLDPELQALVKAVINTESRYIAAFPYCGAHNAFLRAVVDIITQERSNHREKAV